MLIYNWLLLFLSLIYLTEMSDTSATTSLPCSPDEVNVGGTCKSENPAALFMAYACLLVLGQTPKQSGGQGVAMWSGMHCRAPSPLLLMSWACVPVSAGPRLHGDGPQPGCELHPGRFLEAGRGGKEITVAWNITEYEQNMVRFLWFSISRVFTEDGPLLSIYMNREKYRSIGFNVYMTFLNKMSYISVSLLSAKQPPSPSAPVIVSEVAGNTVYLKCSFGSSSNSSLGYVVAWSRLSPEGRKEELKQETTIQTSAFIELDGFNLRLGDKVWCRGCCR